jgi:ADP-ribose pyrophosphatase YjhB (NUDIX family)
MKPKFNNVPNEHLTLRLSDGTNVIKRDIWISRANAVDGIVLAITDDGMVVLVVKRSNKMINEANKFCVPCGYLDWNETRYEGMLREVYEETSLNLPDYDKYLIFDNDKQPFRIKDNPKDSVNQNISHIYINLLDFRGNMQDFPIEIQNFTCNETAAVKWLPLIEFYNVSREWAFNHNDDIKSAVSYVNNNCVTKIYPA